MTWIRPFHLLVIEDEDLVLESIKSLLPSSWKMTSSSSYDQYQKCLDRIEKPDAALVDLHLSRDLDQAEGLKVMGDLRQQHPHIEILAYSGDLNRHLMESSLQKGATRFLAKPLHPDEFLLTLAKIEELMILRGSPVTGSMTGSKSGGLRPWVGNSAQAQMVQRQIAQLKGEPGPILIEGESGTGKEIVAHLLHSQRSDQPWVTVNIASIPENLFESEFFGHIRGAFTGADFNKMGLAEAAQHGDLFLDEIEALSLPSQAKLLRFLESGEIRKVGARESTQVSCRVIVATNRSLSQMSQQGLFREDLWWRLAGKRIVLPPLRQRPQDIVLLAEYFLNSDSVRKKILEEEAGLALMQHSWPGNVRELKRVCEQLLLHSPLPIVRKSDVVACMGETSTRAVVLKEEGQREFSEGLHDIVNRFEGTVISECLERYSNIDETARTLKISRSSLYKKIKDHNINWGGS